MIFRLENLLETCNSILIHILVIEVIFIPSFDKLSFDCIRNEWFRIRLSNLGEKKHTSYCHYVHEYSVRFENVQCNLLISSLYCSPVHFNWSKNRLVSHAKCLNDVSRRHFTSAEGFLHLDSCDDLYEKPLDIVSDERRSLMKHFVEVSTIHGFSKLMPEGIRVKSHL